MIFYFTPYSLEKDLGKGYNDYMKLIGDDDWACFTDGDVMFLRPDFGHQIAEYVQNYPNTGLFTAYTNRVGTLEQCYQGKISDENKIDLHIFLSKIITTKNIKKINHVISGHLMLIKKSVWKRVGGFPEKEKKANILGVDNVFSQKILDAGLEILVMEGVYVWHTYRLGDTNNTSHLK